MPFNGAGVFQRVRNWVADATAGIKIRADFHDAEDDGFAAGLSNCITKDGQTTITQNIPFNSKRITGLADPINAQDASTKAYIDAIIAALPPPIPAGCVADFAMATAPSGWLVCDGSAVSRTTYAALFTAIATTWGAGDGSTTFNLPPASDRYRRSTGTRAGAVGTLQASTNLTHTHTAAGSTGAADRSLAHQHPINLTSGTDYPDHTHSYTSPALSPGTGTSPNYFYAGLGSASTGGASARHQHSVSGWTDAGYGAVDHLHSYNITTTASGDANEARPLSATFLTCIKT